MVKAIIDEHFKSNYNYYKAVCFKFYKGRYLAEDLLHKTYEDFLNTNPETVLEFQKANKLKYLGIRIIKRLHSHKGRFKRHRDGSTSELFEVTGSDPNPEFVYEYVEKDHQAIERNIEKAGDFIKQKLQSPHDFFEMAVFCQAQNESILSISNKTNINRRALTIAYDSAQKQLLQHLRK